MNFAVYTNLLGNFRMEYEGDCLTYLKKLHTEVTDFGTKTEFTDKVWKELTEYFQGVRKEFDIPYKMQGTDFQKSVWKALCHIPYGETRSYKDIAKTVGNEKASRAVGIANNKNPITIIVPCHRVIGANGKLVGYAGGLPMKEYILKMENENK